MPRAGQVRIPLTRRMAADTADWLANVYVPPPADGIGGLTPADQELQIEQARCLASILRKSARRRRSNENFVCLVERELARWIGAKWEAVALTRGALVADNAAGFIGVPFNVQRALASFRAAAGGRPGRPRLSLAKLERRESGEVEHLDERHRKRVARRARYERRVADWHRRGNTFLGSDEPYPEK